MPTKLYIKLLLNAIFTKFLDVREEWLRERVEGGSEMGVSEKEREGEMKREWPTQTLALLQ